MLELASWLQERLGHILKAPVWAEPIAWLRECFEGPQQEYWAAILRSFRWDNLLPAQRRLLEAALRKE